MRGWHICTVGISLQATPYPLGMLCKVELPKVGVSEAYVVLFTDYRLGTPCLIIVSRTYKHLATHDCLCVCVFFPAASLLP